MLVTRNDQFTDWIFQGAHMHEKEATVGVGLLEGHIYFRYSDDFLKDGERIQRSRSFITLSDGTSYELGSGEVAHKVTVIDKGVTSSGEVNLEVRGVDGSGVGVFSITRHVTIEYDDGKVPVLDTDQLNMILAELSDNLTDSMVNTAEAVKLELRNELNTNLADVQVRVQNIVNENLQGVRNDISGLQTSLKEWEETTEDTLNGLNNRIDNIHVPSVVHMQCATPGQYTVDAGGTNNLVGVAPEGMSGSTFVYDNSRKTIKVAGGAYHKDRMLRVTVTSDVELRDGADGVVYVGLRNGSDDSVGAQQVLYVNKSKMGDRVSRVQFSIETLIAANDGSHPALTTGYKLVAANKAGANVIFTGRATLCFTLTTV